MCCSGCLFNKELVSWFTIWTIFCFWGNLDCQHSLDIALWTCEVLGVPLAVEKSEGPATCLPFLGIEVDTVDMELRLPPTKLEKYRLLVKS